MCLTTGVLISNVSVKVQTQQTVLKGPQSDWKHTVHLSEEEKYFIQFFFHGRIGMVKLSLSVII